MRGAAQAIVLSHARIDSNVAQYNRHENIMQHAIWTRDSLARNAL